MIALAASMWHWITSHHTNFEWVLLLMISVAISVYGTQIPNRLKQRTKPRSHNALKLVNDCLARHQLSYLSFFLTLLITGNLGDATKKVVAVFIIIGVIFYQEAVNHSTIFGDATVHEGCTGVACNARLSWRERCRLCRINIVLSSCLFTVGIIFAFLVH